jgi:hypothetical protein
MPERAEADTTAQVGRVVGAERVETDDTAGHSD